MGADSNQRNSFREISHLARLLRRDGWEAHQQPGKGAMRIGLFGQFGSGNLGNDGSLEVAIGLLKRIRPDAELVCICPGPAIVEATYGIPAVSIAERATEERPRPPLARPFLNVVRRVRNLLRPLRQTRDLDAIVIPGTGILDDFCESPFGWPYVILRWCLAARWNGVPVYFVSVGAGPIRHWLSKIFLTSAARIATFRSYRDRLSKDFMTSSEIDTSGDQINCDLAFRLPAPPAPIRSGSLPISVGVGLMTYAGWVKGAEAADTIYAVYVEKMRNVVSWLLDNGIQVRLLIGGVADGQAVRDVVKDLQVSTGNLVTTPIASLQQLMAEIGQTDLVIATRYHNVVSALRMGRPTISLGYANKNDELLWRTGLGEYCHDVETFDPEVIKHQVLEIFDRRQALQPKIRHVVEGFCMALDEQAILLCRLFASSSRAGEVPLSCPDHGQDCPSS